MNKKYIVALIALIFILIIAGVFFGGQSSTNRADNELVVAVAGHGGEPEEGFDPMLGWGDCSEPLIQSTLFKITRNMTIENDLATDWESNDDFTEYVVKLRDDVKFTDNSTLDAEDVAFSYNEAKRTGFSSVDLSSLNNATVVDKNTVKFELNRSDSTFIDKLLHIGIVPSDSYNNETYGNNPIGSGPFKFVQWDKGQQVILEKNPNYYGKQPKFDKLTILFEQNEAALNSAKNKEVDIAEVPLTYAKESVDGYDMYLTDSYDVRGISLIPQNADGHKIDGYEVGNNVTADKSIRQALNYGIDRDIICNGALNGAAIPTFDGVSHLLPWANPEANIEDGDVDKAKEILKAGGWEDPDGDGIVEKDGLKASFDLYYASDAPERQAIAISVAEQAKKFGIDINPIGSNWDEINQIKFSNSAVWGYGSSDPYALYKEYHSSQIGIGYNNPAVINNSAIDAHIDNAMKMDRESSYPEWAGVSWDGTTGMSPKGDASWLWVSELKYGYLVDKSLDISNETILIQPHGGDIFGNIYDWSRVSSINQ